MNENNENMGNNSAKSDNTKNIIIIVLSIAVLFLIVAVVVLSVLLAKKNNEKEPSATDQEYSAVLTQASNQESENKSYDVSAISDCMTAAEYIAISPMFYLPAGAEFVLSIDGGEVSVYQSDNGALKEWKALVEQSCLLRSSEFKKISGKIVGTLQPSGSVNWYAEGISAILEYSPDFGKRWGLQ